MDDNADEKTNAWWGEFALAPGETRYWCVGVLRIAVLRLASEWQVTHDEGGNVEAAMRAASDDPQDAPKQAANGHRYLYTETTPRLEVRPRLPDRPVVTRPDTPLDLAPGQSVTLYIATPLWFGLATAAQDSCFSEVPIGRPSDTWFGPSTRDGELCYATRSSARLSLEDVPARPHRAIAPLTITNRGTDFLRLERLSLPVAGLSLFVTGEGQLWTQALHLTRHQASSDAELELAKAPPAHLGPVRPVSGPREQNEGSALVRALTSLFN